MLKPVLKEDLTKDDYELNLSVDPVIELSEKGYSTKEIASILNNSPETIKRQIKEIQHRQGVLLEYRAVQGLQLTDIQRKLLAAMTEEKIAEAPLRDLVNSFKVLKDKELVMDGKPTEIHGLVGYLMHLEKEENGEVDITPEEEWDEGEPLPDL